MRQEVLFPSSYSDRFLLTAMVAVKRTVVGSVRVVMVKMQMVRVLVVRMQVVKTVRVQIVRVQTVRVDQRMGLRMRA